MRLMLVVVSSSCAAAAFAPASGVLSVRRADAASTDVVMSTTVVKGEPGYKRQQVKSLLSKFVGGVVSTRSVEAGVASWYDQGARLQPCESWYDSGRRLKDAAAYAEKKATYDARRLVLLPPTGANKPQVKVWPSLGGTAGPHRGAGTMPPPPVRELWTPPEGWKRPTVDPTLRPPPVVSSWYDASQLTRIETLRAEGAAVVARRAEIAAALQRKQRRSWFVSLFKRFFVKKAGSAKTAKAQAAPAPTPAPTAAATPAPKPTPKAAASRPVLRKKVRVSEAAPPSGFEWGGSF